MAILLPAVSYSFSFILFYDDLFGFFSVAVIPTGLFTIQKILFFFILNKSYFLSHLFFSFLINCWSSVVASVVLPQLMQSPLSTVKFPSPPTPQNSSILRSHVWFIGDRTLFAAGVPPFPFPFPPFLVKDLSRVASLERTSQCNQDSRPVAASPPAKVGMGLCEWRGMSKAEGRVYPGGVAVCTLASRLRT